MKRDKYRKTPEIQQASRVEDQLSDDELYDDAVSKSSADYYERSWKNRIEVRQLDIWIAAGLYLVVSSIALVVLF